MTISACMIVRDEEKQIEKCLESIWAWVDEIIVVDTGSVDKTICLAKGFGAKVKVYEIKWENDFSKARNYSIAQATGDWILIIDADEELVNGAKLKEIIHNCEDKDSIEVYIHNLFTCGSLHKGVAARMFKRDTISYEGRIHNKAVYNQPSLKSDMVINHYGYDPMVVDMGKKVNRSLPLIIEEIKKDPHQPMFYFYAAKMYLVEQQHNKAIYCMENIRRITPLFAIQDSVLMEIYYLLAKYYAKSGKFNKSDEVCTEGYWLDDTNLDILYITGDFEAYLKVYDDIESGKIKKEYVLNEFGERAKQEALYALEKKRIEQK